MINKLKIIRRGKFQHSAIIADIEKLYFGRRTKNAIGNVKSYDDVIYLYSQYKIYYLNISKNTRHSCIFLIEVILRNHMNEILIQSCRNRVQIWLQIWNDSSQYIIEETEDVDEA